MISVIILPMALIAGIYGMNFEKDTRWWPRLDDPWGVVVALLLMVTSGLSALGLFKWRGWL